MSDLLTITISQWAKFNARADRANFTWFRMQNNFLHDKSVFPLSDAQVVLYLFLISEASKENSGSFDVRVSYISALRKKSREEILNDLEVIAAGKLIRVAPRHDEQQIARHEAGVTPSESRHDAGEPPAQSPATNERTNEPPCDGVTPPADGELLRSGVKTRPRNNAKSPPSTTTELWNHYARCLQERRDIEAAGAGARANKHCKDLVDRHGLELARRIVEAFVGDEDKWVREQAWPLPVLISREQKYLALAKKRSNGKAGLYSDLTTDIESLFGGSPAQPNQEEAPSA